MQYGFSDVSGATDLRVCGPRSIDPAGALLHTTSGQNSLKWLQVGSANAGTPASADYLIGRSGQRYGITPKGRYAYHAGQSALTYNNRVYRGDEVSQFLIGIEIECANNERPTSDQYRSLAECLHNLAIAWRWPIGYPVYGHYAVAVPMGRRSDPLAFDWGYLYLCLNTNP